MCSEIDARTRENPEAAMLQSKMHTHSWHAHNAEVYAAQERATRLTPDQQKDLIVWWRQNGADPGLQRERESMAQGNQVAAPHSDAIDSAAYRAFMRGLG
jgi:hypothetical protein